MIEPSEKAGLRNAWERVAAAYDEQWAERTVRFAERGLDLLAPAAGGTGLDIGSGPGLTTVALARRLDGGTAIGVDFAPAMVERARARWMDSGRVSFEVDDAENLAQPDGAFDVVTSTFTLMYCYDPLRMIGHAARTLRPGGRLLTIVWGRHDRVWWSPGIEIVETRAEYFSAVCPLMFFYGLPGVLPRMLEQMGLTVDGTADVGEQMRYADVEEAVSAAILAGPLAGLFHNRLDDARKREAWQAMTERVAAAATKDGDGIALPGEALAIVATKPR